jgi:hypothetical protein
MAIGACIQNILLAAHSLGLGTCWLGEILNKKQEVCLYLRGRKGIRTGRCVIGGVSRRENQKRQQNPFK